MKYLLTAVSALALTSTGFAQSLMLNFTNSSSVGDPYLTLSPAHEVGGLSTTETTWNNFTSAATASSLLYGDGSAATGITVTFGNESSAGSGTLNFADQSQIRTNVALGTGGAVSGKQRLIGGQVEAGGAPTSTSSIYGQDTSSTAAARYGWLGQSNTAIGLRIDGLVAGDYVVYVMARNTNSNGEQVPIDIYSKVGNAASTLEFISASSPLTKVTQSNLGYANNSPNAYNDFVAGETYVALTFTIGSGESLYLISDGGSAGELRGFLNSVQIVAVPEPAEVSLLIAGALGLLAFVRRRRAA